MNWHILVFLRTSAGLLQKTLCDYLGVSQNTWSCWEKGIHTPRLANLEQISSYLKIDIGEFFVEEVSNPTQNIGYLPIYDGSSFFSMRIPNLIQLFSIKTAYSLS